MIFNKLKKSNFSYIKLTFESMEFMIGNIEIKEIVFHEYYEYDEPSLSDFEIDELNAYISGTQIDIEDENILSDDIWETIYKKIEDFLDRYYGIEAFFEKLIENEIYLPKNLVNIIDIDNYKSFSKLPLEILKTITEDNYKDILNSF